MADAFANAAAKPVKLDDLMLAMDVVDTLRHQETFVARELNEDAREKELIARLRRIYRDQGIEVSDSTIDEGVKALKESRFVYTPPKPGFGVTMARLWISRGKIAAWVFGLLGALSLASLGYYFLVERPAILQAEDARTELSQTLPKALDAAFAGVIDEAKTPAAKPLAEQLLADGKAALAREDAAGAKAAVGGLQKLTAKLKQSYQLLIVARPGESSGVFRIPDRNTEARNYYLIVEAVGADGRPLELPVASEENGGTKTVTKWGLRVDKKFYDQVAADKADDGIIQNRKVGEKKRGSLDVDYAIPTSGGAITQW